MNLEMFSNMLTEDLDVKAVTTAIDGFKNSIGKTLELKPTHINLPYHVVEYLKSEGYDTEEKIIKLINDIIKSKRN